MSKTVERSAAKTFLESIGTDLSGKTEDKIDDLMTKYGYTWNEYTQKYYADPVKALKNVNIQIKKAIADGEPEEVINDLKL